MEVLTTGTYSRLPACISLNTTGTPAPHLPPTCRSRTPRGGEGSSLILIHSTHGAGVPAGPAEHQVPGVLGSAAPGPEEEAKVVQQVNNLIASKLLELRMPDG